MIPLIKYLLGVLSLRTRHGLALEVDNAAGVVKTHQYTVEESVLSGNEPAFFRSATRRRSSLVSGALIGMGMAGSGLHAALPDDGPGSRFEGKIAVSIADSIPHWPEPAKATAGAPNVVVILLDDVGFAASSTFGGPVATPELDSLAATGLRYNNFHVVGVCSSTRAALLAGRNHHRVGYGTVTEYSNGYPGYNTLWPKDAASVAQVLRDNGYSTSAFGKWHNTPAWEISPVGPFDRWPTGLGFEYFYGFLRGEDSQWEPELYQNTTPIDAPKTPAAGYHFTTDITDQAIGWLHTHQSLAPDKPYFLYFATGATHEPHHAPKEWIERYRGRFEQGWDQLREEIFARQKKLGVVPADALLTPRPAELAAWSSLSDDEKRLAARQMEVFAGFLAHTDYEIGRLIHAVRSAPGGDNTLIFYIVGDNGAPHSRGPDGSENLLLARSVQERLSTADRLGGPTLQNNYGGPWGWVTNTPFHWGKIIASHFGGTRDPLIVSWPKRIHDGGGLRTQFAHVIDIVPTILETAGINMPPSIDGVRQKPLDGISLAYTFADKAAPARHQVQYFEVFGNRAIYENGWLAAARRRRGVPITEDKWELYHVAEDFSEAIDLAAKYPQRLQELQRVFDREARNNDVYPLLGGSRLPDGSTPWHPRLMEGRKTFVFHSDLPRIPTTASPDFFRSHRISADLVIPPGGAEGTIVAQGSRTDGFILYIKNGRLIYDNNYSGQGHDVIVSTLPVPPGKVTVQYEFVQRGRSGRSRYVDLNGTGKLSINGRPAGEGDITHFRNMGSAAWLYYGAFGIGRSYVSPVSDAYTLPFTFTGQIEKVTVELE